jgi:hypothetical protein
MYPTSVPLYQLAQPRVKRHLQAQFSCGELRNALRHLKETEAKSGNGQMWMNERT